MGSGVSIVQYSTTPAFTLQQRRSGTVQTSAINENEPEYLIIATSPIGRAVTTKQGVANSTSYTEATFHFR